MSSSVPIIFNSLPSWNKSSPHLLKLNIINSPSFSKTTFKSHICFTFNNKSSEFDREESRWLREEQRWLREEQRWIREEKRWENERQSLLNQIQSLKNEIAEFRSGVGNNSNSNSNSVANLLRLLKKEKEISQIAETGTSASPLVVEADAKAVEDVVEEVVVKEVVVKEEVKVDEKKEVLKKKRTTLRVGSEGDEVQMLQEALLKLGFYCGEEDEEFSAFSSGTERAVKTWQASIGVPETGMVTSELLDILFKDHQETTSDFKEGANGVAVTTSVTQVPEIPSKIGKDDPKPYISDDRVFLLGENRWEDASRLTNRSSQNQSQTDSKGVVTTRCLTCRGVGRLLCLECDGTGEPNIEPQFLEWVGEDTKCPYCEGAGHTTCDVCIGTGVTSA